jgi:hypothetical protein
MSAIVLPRRWYARCQSFPRLDDAVVGKLAPGNFIVEARVRVSAQVDTQSHMCRSATILDSAFSPLCYNLAKELLGQSSVSDWIERGVNCG